MFNVIAFAFGKYLVAFQRTKYSYHWMANEIAASGPASIVRVSILGNEMFTASLLLISAIVQIFCSIWSVFARNILHIVFQQFFWLFLPLSAIP